MEKLFENLFIYEIVLLFLGVFLFMILCGSLVYSIAKKYDIKKLLYFFIVPIIMIAYPSIQEIQIEKDKLAIIKYQDKVKNNPDDEDAKENLAKVTDKLEKRASTPADLAVISKSYLLLEKPEKAISFADKAIYADTKTLTIRPETKETTPTDVIKNDVVENRVEALKGIKALADIQKDIKKDSTVLKDSLLLKARIQNVKTTNPKIQQYFNKKYVQRKLSTINKN
ncbi:hypothetical protein [Hwangdonia lutea]|uniref:Uncharacterized protein n=1 Tax=Hwangdonia lutea TaxID=3075823 RepID=A0AA97ELX4_9FLAO|nr:hypothetical protein [Hwangdonia sp. SCSIO 19198]WOD42844.1 hypothetical protein RNZ46_12675 [Hwangdonia sp. SCSIO 19198]